MKKHLFLFALIVTLSQWSFAQWIPLNAPSLTAIDFYEPVAIDDSLVWTINMPLFFDDVRPLYKSTDGGANWTAVPIETADSTFANTQDSVLTPVSLFALNENELWAGMIATPAQQFGAVVKSTDGGASWEKLAVPFADTLEAPMFVHFFNSDTGVVMTAVYPIAPDFGLIDAVSSPLQIYYTEDGGDSWTNVSPALMEDESRWFYTPSVDDIVHGDTLWYGTRHGRILRSVNQGKDWEIIDTGLGRDHNVNSISFLDAQRGFATLGVPQDIYAYPTIGLKTTDGGTTWEPANIPERVETLHHITGTEGIIGLANWIGSYGYFLSVDGGENWERIHSGTQIYTLDFSPEGAVYAGGIAYQGGIHKYAGPSVDEITIEPTDPPSFIEQGVGVLGTRTDNYSISDIQLLDTNTIWASTRIMGVPAPDAVALVLKSTDGGESWEVFEVEEFPGRFLWDIHAFDENRVIATTQNFGPIDNRGIIMTEDGGETWTEVVNDPAGGRWIHFFNDQEGIFWDLNFVWRSEDGGYTWEILPEADRPQFQPGERSLMAYATNSKATMGDKAFFGTTYGRIFYTEDKGKTWSSTSVDPQRTINSISFRDSLNGLAVSGQNQFGGPAFARFYSTSDGGLTWQLLPPFPFPYFSSSVQYVPGSENSYVATSGFFDYATFITHDGGNTWEILDDVHAFGAIAFLSPTLGWIGRGEAGGTNTAALYKWDGEPFPAAQPDQADLELYGAVNAIEYDIYRNYTFTVTVRNQGPEAMADIKISAPLPDNVAYTSHSTRGGNYNLYFEEWTIPFLRSGESATLQLTLFTLSDAAPIDFFAQITNADLDDPDSTPGNNTTGTPAEDDELLITITPASNGVSSLQLSPAGKVTNGMVQLNDMIVFPNPAADHITVKATFDQEIEKAQVLLFDKTGKVVRQMTVSTLSNTLQTEMSLQDLPSNLYLLQIRTEDGLWTQKVLKQ